MLDLLVAWAGSASFLHVWVKSCDTFHKCWRCPNVDPSQSHCVSWGRNIFRTQLLLPRPRWIGFRGWRLCHSDEVHLVIQVLRPIRPERDTKTICGPNLVLCCPETVENLEKGGYAKTDPCSGPPPLPRSGPILQGRSLIA